MSRLLTDTEVLIALLGASDSVVVYREASGTHGSTTLSTASVVADPSIAVAGVTNFTDLDPVIIRGSGGDELNQINEGGAVASPITLLNPVRVANPIGATVVEAVAVPLGHISDAGVTTTASGGSTPVTAATSRLALTTIANAATLSIAFALKGFNIPNWQFLHGAPESQIGSGTAAAKYQGRIAGDTVATQGYQVVRVGGLRADGWRIECDFYNAVVIVGGGTTMNRGAANDMPVTLEYTSAIMRQWLP